VARRVDGTSSVDVDPDLRRRYELPTNLQNFKPKNLTKVKIFQKVF